MLVLNLSWDVGKQHYSRSVFFSDCTKRCDSFISLITEVGSIFSMANQNNKVYILYTKVGQCESFFKYTGYYRSRSLKT